MKKVFLFVSIGIILLGIPATIFLVGQNQELRQRAAPATTLSLSPSTVNAKTGDTFSLEVKLDSANNQVAVVQIHILYDPTKLQAVDITNGPLAPSIRASGKIDPGGVASITVGAKDNTTPITGAGTIAVLTMKAATPSATPLSVKFAPAPDTYANAIGEGQNNVLVGTTQASVTILNADGSQAQADASNTNTVSQSDAQAATVAANATPTDTPEASQSASMSIGFQDTTTNTSTAAPVITSLTQNQSVTTQTPLIQGKGIPGSTITIVIHSASAQTATVTVDANGNWSYTPTAPLDPGPHTVQAMATDPTTGQTQTTTTAIVVSGGSTSESPATGSAMPATGSTQVTIFLIALGTFLLVSGALLPVFIQ